MTGNVLRLPDGRLAVPGNRWDLVPDSSRARRPFVSVIIPYYDGREQLDLVLEGLALQDYPAERFEIVVVDDGSPEPLARPDTGPGQARIRTLRQEDRGFRAAAARNLGASVAQGEVLCFLDQDTVPGPAYLRRLIRLPATVPDALVVGRRRHVDLRDWTPARLRSWLTGTGPAPTEFDPPGWLAEAYRDRADLLITDDTSYRFVISAVMSCSAQLFQEIGGFDESFTRYGGEDWELAFRAYNAGAVLAHEPTAVAWHDGPDWAERGDPDERRRDQAEQQRALARLLPATVRIGTDPPQTPPGPAELIVTWTNTAGIDPARLSTGVRALLDSPGRPTIYLDPGQLQRCDLPTGTERAFTGPPPPAVLARALDLIRLDGDGEPAPDDLILVRDRLRTGAAGRVRLHSSGSAAVAPVLIGVALRAERRAARWQIFAPEVDLIEALFGNDDVDSGQLSDNCPIDEI